MSIGLKSLDRAKEDEIILKPFYYICEVPSKYHNTLCLAFNHWLQVPHEKVDQIGKLLHIAHTATLIIDDIQDGSMLRYGIPSAHLVYSVGLTINAASQAFIVAIQKVQELEHPKAMPIYLEGFLEVHRGQGLDIYWRDNFLCPTEDEYMDMIKQKAAAFFTTAVQLLQLFSASKENYVKIATLIGIYYPITDDYCNLFNREALKGLSDNIIQASINDHKDSDITDGKFTLPIIYAMKNSDSAQEILNIIKQRTTDTTKIKQCVSLLEECGAEKYIREVLLRLESDIQEEIRRLGGNPILTKLVKELGKWRRNGE